MANRCVKCTTLIDKNENKGTVDEPICTTCFTDGIQFEFEEVDDFVEVSEADKSAVREKHQEIKKENKTAQKIEGIFGILLFVVGSGMTIVGFMAGIIHFFFIFLAASGIGAFIHALSSGAFSNNNDDPLDELLIEKGINPSTVEMDARLKRENKTVSETVGEIRKGLN